MRHIAVVNLAGVTQRFKVSCLVFLEGHYAHVYLVLFLRKWIDSC